MPKKVEIEMDGVKKTVEVKTPKKKLCSITDVLPASVIALVKANPNNDTIRNLMLAHLKVPVPPEEDDFEKVKKWIEYNVDKPAKPKTAYEREEEERRRQQEEYDRMDRERRANEVRFRVEATQRQHGRCSYHVNQRGSGEMPITRSVLAQLAGASNNAQNFFGRIEEYLAELSPDNYITMQDHGEEDHDDYDSDETTDEEVTIPEASRQVIKDALRTINPDYYRALFGE